MRIRDWTLQTVNIEDLRATDLRQECAAAEKECDTEIHCYLLLSDDERPEVAQMAYFPGYGRAGIAWGADAVWTDCQSAEEAVRRWSEDEMIE